jgi:hypothetical protein
MSCHKYIFSNRISKDWCENTTFPNSSIVLVSTLRRGIFTRLYLKYSTINNRVLNTRNIYNIFLTFFHFNFSIFPLQSQTFPCIHSCHVIENKWNKSVVCHTLKWRNIKYIYNSLELRKAIASYVHYYIV